MGKHAFVLLAIIGVVLASCSIDSSEDEISETVEPQISSNAPISLTDEATSSTGSLPETDAEFEVTFDGSDCWVDGPHEVPVGDHTFNFINTSDFMGELWLVFLHEDKTFQDHNKVNQGYGIQSRRGFHMIRVSSLTSWRRAAVMLRQPPGNLIELESIPFFVMCPHRKSSGLPLRYLL